MQTQVLAQRLPRFTPATRTDAAWIAADLQRIRTRGYLLTTDEVVAGAATVAAPVRDASGQVVAVLSAQCADHAHAPTKATDAAAARAGHRREAVPCPGRPDRRDRGQAPLSTGRREPPQAASGQDAMAAAPASRLRRTAFHSSAERPDRPLI